jgi:basic membrane protein A
MKKILAMTMALAMLLSLAACGKDVSSSGDTTTAETQETATTETESGADTADGDVTTVGFVYIGDNSEAYTANFIAAQTAIEETFGDSVVTIAKYNVAEDSVESPLRELAESGCDIIFTTSFGYGEVAKELAVEYPDVQFCQATCEDATDDVPNYHNYMGTIYQGRYISGVVAGLKLAEMIDNGEITTDQAKIGYVGAFPYAEVISGYTAFLLGVRSVVPEATMEVNYANSWGDYDTEKTMATAMIEDGCVIISQHSDTEGPAEACEAAMANGTTVYCVAYNQDMTDVAPNTCLISSRIDWAPYEVSAVQAVIDGTEIPRDDWAGFDEGWVAMTDLNTAIAAEGTQDKIDELTAAFADGSLTSLDVFSGDYTGTNPWDETDTIDLSAGFNENESKSAPAFSYVLDGVITVLSTN